MANGDAVLRDLVTCVYTDDAARQYLHSVPSYLQGQAAAGWTIATLGQTATLSPFRPGLKMRSWLLWNAADTTQRARVSIGTNAAYIAASINTTTLLHAYRGYELTMTVYGLEGERTRGRRTDRSVQAAIPA